MCPKIYAREPAVLELEPGIYFWCSCGLSGHQPMCDGEHTGTGMRSKKFTLTEKAVVKLCNCKQTRNPPYCDGSHETVG
jgi:CDGSH-type Zn-finger protein